MLLNGTESPTCPPPLTYPGCGWHPMPQAVVDASAVEHPVGRTPHYAEGAASGGPSFAVWGQSWSGCRVTVQCENQSRTCRDHHIMRILRTLAFIEVSHSFALSPQYISTTDNHRADDLSRNCLSSFVSKVPDADCTTDTTTDRRRGTT